ncbi:MAG: hypothetical protein ACT4OM_00255 [Actinomycetota bacterium]
MATTAVDQSEPQSISGPARQAMSWGEDLVTMLLGLWLMGGLALDGWAHTNLPGLETFFTPWHAVFYSGFGATALWVLWRTKRRMVPGLSFSQAVPRGYGLGLVGLGLFAAGGMGDMIWHVIFGVETQIDALMSPTHVLLFAGVILVVTSPFRAAWSSPGHQAARSAASFLPVTLSLALTAGLTAFMFLYLSPFLNSDMGANDVRSLNQSYTGEGFEYVRFLSLRGAIAGFLVTTVILYAPVLLALRRWHTPMFSATAIFVVVAALIQGVSGFTGLLFVPVAVIGGLSADLLIRYLRPNAGTANHRIFAGLAPPLLWLSYVAVVAVTQGIGWEIEFWSGVVVWTSLIGLGLSLLMLPPPLPETDR